jgi:hypothetical protein
VPVGQRETMQKAMGMKRRAVTTVGRQDHPRLVLSPLCNLGCLSPFPQRAMRLLLVGTCIVELSRVEHRGDSFTWCDRIHRD